MHFDWYLDNRLSLYAYGRYFWYLELSRATRIYSAYADGEFAGVLLAEIYGESRAHSVFTEKLYVKIMHTVQLLLFRDGAGVYEETVREQLGRYLPENRPDGEIIFLAADPALKGKGIGTALLGRLEKDMKGKKLFLVTDDACSYGFYEHRGFDRADEKDIIMKMPKGEIPLKCFIFDKEISG